MPVSEKWNSRRISGGESPSFEIGYLVLGTDDEAAAMAELLDYAPDTWGNAPRQLPDLEQISDQIWEGTITYSFSNAAPPDEEEDAAISFSTKGGRQKITQSRGTQSYGRTGDENPPPDYKGAIGVSSHGGSLTVEGVEIPVPALSISFSRRKPPEWLTASQLMALSDLTGTINSTTFKGFPPGELIFDGAEGSQKNPDEPVDVKFDFIRSANATNQTWGEITVDSKKGWQYLWFLYEEEEDDEASQLVKRPIAAYVEDVSPSADHGAIGV